MMRRGMALRSSSPFQRGSGLEAPSPVALAQEKQRQEMWEKTGIVSLRDQGLQVQHSRCSPSLRLTVLQGPFCL